MKQKSNTTFKRIVKKVMFERFF